MEKRIDNREGNIFKRESEKARVRERERERGRKNEKGIQIGKTVD